MKDMPENKLSEKAPGATESAPENSSENAEKISAEKEDGHTAEDGQAAARQERLDPTRYGDWEKNGRCIDF